MGGAILIMHATKQKQILHRRRKAVLGSERWDDGAGLDLLAGSRRRGVL